MNQKIIYVADNQDLTREGIISFLSRYFKEEAVIETVAYRDQLFSRVQEQPPFLIVIDPENFDWDILPDFTRLKKMLTDGSILVFTEILTYSQAKEVVDAGINHFIMKSGAEEDFFTVFKAIVNKKKYISGEIYDLLLQKDRRKTDVSPVKLSNSEIEIARLIAEGRTTKEIAAYKHLSFHTINTHRKNIFRKLGINSSNELVKYVYNAGLSGDIEYHI